MRTFLWLLPLLLLAVGCRSDEAEMADDVEQIYPVRGVYVSPQYEGQAAIIDHEPIPDYMEAMRMAFRLHDPQELDGLEPGTKVAFDLYLTGTTSYIRNLEPLPDTTTLTLPHLEPQPPEADTSEEALYEDPEADSLLAPTDSPSVPTP